MSRSLCRMPPWHLLPIFLGVVSACGMITTYYLAKKNCHVEKWFLPYISYTGTEHPESSIFGLFLNVEGFLGIVVVVLAWRFIRHVVPAVGQKNYLNSAALVSGIMSCFGVVMVGNFQVSKNKVPHYIGAGLAFIVGTVYCTLSSILTHSLHRSVPRRQWSMFVCMVRHVCAGVMILSIIILMVVGVLKLENKLVNKKNYSGMITTPAPPIIPVYKFPNGSCVPFIQDVPIYKRYVELVGSVTEWLLTACLLLTLSLYAYEFKSFHNVKIVLKKRGMQIEPSSIQRSFPTVKTDSYDFMSPNSSLLSPAHSDTTILHITEKPPFNRNSDEIVFTYTDQNCKNNNKESSTENSAPKMSDVSKSLPNITSNI